MHVHNIRGQISVKTNSKPPMTSRPGQGWFGMAGKILLWPLQVVCGFVDAIVRKVSLLTTSYIAPIGVALPWLGRWTSRVAYNVARKQDLTTTAKRGTAYLTAIVRHFRQQNVLHVEVEYSLLLLVLVEVRNALAFPCQSDTFTHVLMRHYDDKVLESNSNRLINYYRANVEPCNWTHTKLPNATVLTSISRSMSQHSPVHRRLLQHVSSGKARTGGVDGAQVGQRAQPVLLPQCCKHWEHSRCCAWQHITLPQRLCDWMQGKRRLHLISFSCTARLCINRNLGKGHVRKWYLWPGVVANLYVKMARRWWRTLARAKVILVHIKASQGWKIHSSNLGQQLL